MKSLVIVESPAKAKTLEKFLGKDFKVLASGGHVRDLPASKLGVDVEKDFAPSYITIKGKSKIVKNLIKAAEKVAVVYLAPDPDREGEAIAWHLKYLIKSDKKIKRIEFHEITKDAVTNAIKHPRKIDMNRVDAQQTRRILDRLVGYKLSPLLWKKVRRGLSAGRVQSITVKLICERENEVRAFNPQEYWSIEALLNKGEEARFLAKYLSKEIISKEEAAKKIVDESKNNQFIVSDAQKKEQKRHSAPPFITSTLQQDAARKLGFSAQKTMSIAQQLYEGVKIEGEGAVGLITYMRTDSVRIAKEALDFVRKYIKESIGQEFLPETPHLYKSKKSAQDAHEAIRPTLVTRNPETIKTSLNPDQLKLYTLIWNRFVACQMNPAIMDRTTIDIKAGKHTYRATGSVIKFAGFMQLYLESREDKEEKEEEADRKILPELNIGDILALETIEPKQHFTEPPPRYNEASLIKELESRGIGRPSTYAPTLHTIEARGYVTRENKTFTPTELGETITKLLDEFFPEIMDYTFTAHMEDELDEILEGKITYINVLKEFYAPFEKDLKIANEKMKQIKQDIPTDEICPKCGKNLVIRVGRYGKFFACSGFPECKFTKPVIKSLNVKCTKEDCNGEILIRRTRKGKIFYSCSNYPKCTVAFWDKPIGENCPKCGKPLVEKATKNNIYIKCNNKECDFQRDKI
ncbi:DNA topoisomerase I [candidate division WOR-1 bacterium RIFOXYC2_FULL_37_10]|uniref:DNA topoisomerase 1 n=1 Tax=candidate division WOR-1 bacterium RIFOXYB2_FULL_37_13 TaxID=1802579 RepID=A0A1F4SNQ2_UNCSA|nr:MAG: DNA topoisomerase I [candidate division WOR-1 bacterium RIFOXYB2_FULL_37_13]OGC33085.1 MAG: DNA topoisomerase I [candidate division WOR-1 bacterium RIFOXYC2_FULL_37_10]